MNEYYTLKRAMDLLGFTSTNAFLQLTRKYPDVFANVNPNSNKHRHPWYDKATLDRFHQLREYSNRSNRPKAAGARLVDPDRKV
jgi:hypothetical protein